jgi:hypothetical protein
VAQATRGRQARYKNLMRGLALFIAATVVALGAATSVRGGAQRAHATGRLRVTVSVGTDLFAHLWAAPVRGGGQCYFLTVDRRAALHAQAESALPGCTRVDHLPPTAKHRLSYTIAGPEHACLAGRARCRMQGATVIYGEIEALLPVGRVTALGPGRLLPVRVRGHWFLGRLPSLPRNLYRQWRLVAYGGRGQILGRIYF